MAWTTSTEATLSWSWGAARLGPSWRSSSTSRRGLGKADSGPAVEGPTPKAPTSWGPKTQGITVCGGPLLGVSVDTTPDHGEEEPCLVQQMGEVQEDLRQCQQAVHDSPLPEPRGQLSSLAAGHLSLLGRSPGYGHTGSRSAPPPGISSQLQTSALSRQVAQPRGSRGQWRSVWTGRVQPDNLQVVLGVTSLSVLMPNFHLAKLILIQSHKEDHRRTTEGTSETVSPGQENIAGSSRHTEE